MRRKYSLEMLYQGKNDRGSLASQMQLNLTGPHRTRLSSLENGSYRNPHIKIFLLIAYLDLFGGI